MPLDDQTYPPFPWHMELGDSAIATAHLVDVACVEPLIPAEFHIVRALPGKTLGGLYFATYGPGSALEYNELIVVSALTLRGGRICPWVSHIWVDSPASVAGGRNELGVPKQMGRFSVEVTPHGRRMAVEGVASVEQRRLGLLLPGAAAVESANLDVRDPAGGRAIAFHSRVHGRAGLASARVTLEGPLAHLGFGPAFTSLWGRDVKALMGERPEAFAVTPR